MPISPAVRLAETQLRVDFTLPLAPAMLNPLAWAVYVDNRETTIVQAAAAGASVTLDFTLAGALLGPQRVTYSAAYADLLGLNGLLVAAFEVPIP